MSNVDVYPRWSTANCINLTNAPRDSSDEYVSTVSTSEVGAFTSQIVTQLF